MISVTVRAIMTLAEVFGAREQLVSLPAGARVSDLLRALEEKYGDAFAKAVYGDSRGDLNPLVQVLVNGRSIAFRDGTRTLLADGDDVYFLFPASGG